MAKTEPDEQGWDGIERRADGDRVLAAINDLHVEMSNRLTRLEALREEQVARCNARGRHVEELDGRTTTIEQAIGFRKGDDNTIDVRVKATEKITGYVEFTFKAIAWLSASGAFLYALFMLGLHVAAQNAEAAGAAAKQAIK